MSGFHNRPILGRRHEGQASEVPSKFSVSELFPDPRDSPVWNSAILFSDTSTHQDGFIKKNDDTPFQQDVPVYKPWSTGEQKPRSSKDDSPVKNSSCQTEWSFHPKFMAKEPILSPALQSNSLENQMEHLNLSKPDTYLANHSNVLKRQHEFSPSQSNVSTPQSFDANLTQEKPSVHTERRHCVFCKQNGETKEFYSSHVLKDAKGTVVCPTLRDYVCPICNATGSTAHTVSYCPFNREKSNSFRSFFANVGKGGNTNKI